MNPPVAEPPQGLGQRLRGGINRVLLSQKDRVSDRLGDVADTVRRVADPLRTERYGVLGNYAETAANRLERMASDLRRRDLDDITEDMRRLARRNPAAFLGAGLAAGVIVGRFLKSSAASGDGRGVAAGE